MLRLSVVLRGGGHCDLFPTSKAAAHLNPDWVLSRPVPPAPGKGKCIVQCHRQGSCGNFQLGRPPAHWTSTASLLHSSQGAVVHCSAVGSPSRRVQYIIQGVEQALAPPHKSREHSVANANQQERDESVRRMQNSKFLMPKAPAPVAPGWERTIDPEQLRESMEERTCGCCKLQNDNRNGFYKEWFVWEKKPEVAAPKGPQK